jgi:hypothetical protein
MLTLYGTHSGLAHPNLVALRGFCAQPPCIVTEFVAGGSLDQYLESGKELDWPLRLKIAKDIGMPVHCSLSVSIRD